MRIALHLFYSLILVLHPHEKASLITIARVVIEVVISVDVCDENAMWPVQLKTPADCSIGV